MNQPVFPPVLIGDPDLTPCELAAKQASWGSKAKSLFKQTITLVVLASLQLGTLVQTKEAYAQYVPYGQPTNGQVNGQPNYGYVPPVAGAVNAATNAALTGYTNDGTLFMGGQRIGNPHQILHDAQIPSFMTITATRYTYTDNPNHGQGTLAQMELATTNGSDSSVLLNRLYLSPTNPYTGLAPGPYPNLQTYAGVLTNAQQANYLLTNADDGKTYAFKTLTASSRQAVDLLIRELPNTSQFKAAADPLGGGTGVRVTQNGDAVALAAYLATVKPYDYSWQPNFGTTFGQNGQNPYGGWANSNNFAPDYSEGAGPAQSFQAFIKQLQDSAVANDKKVRSQTSANSLDLSGVNPNSLFGEGYNLFQYGSNSNPNRDLENDFLRRLQAGQLQVGSSDYNEASRIAQERYRIAYATRLETNKPLQYSMADAQRKANELNLAAVNPNELFGQGFDLFQFNKALRANGDAENILLARLQNGELTPGSSEYAQATQIAQERLRQAYSLSLSPPPPKSVSKWKLIVGAVVGAVLTFVTAGALLPYVAGALTSATVAATTAALATVSATVTTAAALATVGISASMTAVLTAVAGVVAGAVGAIASTSITTGSLSEGLKAGGKALVSGGVKAIVAGALGVGFATAGLSGLSGIEGTVSNIALNTLSGAVSSTILGGGSFADNLKASAISSVTTAVADGIGEKFAGAIKEAAPDLGAVGTELAHGALGCVTGMIRSQSGDGCAGGAAGAIAGHLAAPLIFGDKKEDLLSGTLSKEEYDKAKTDAAFYSGVVGGAVASAVGSTDKVNVNFGLGSAAGSNAALNNALSKDDLGAKAQAVLDCKGNANCIKNVNATALAKSLDNNQQINDACAGGKSSGCDQAQADTKEMVRELYGYKAELISARNLAQDPETVKAIQSYINEADKNIASANNQLEIARLQTNGGNYFVKGSGLPADVAIGIGIALDPLDAAGAKTLGKAGSAITGIATGAKEDAPVSKPAEEVVGVNGGGKSASAISPAEPIVKAEGTINDSVFKDVNQKAKSGASNEPTLIADRVTAKAEASGKPFPNGTVAESHAEIGVIQQAYDAGKTLGSTMSMTVSGKDVCGFCKGDIAAAAEASGLKSLTVKAIDNQTGLPKTYYWEPGMKSIKEKP
jgi:hypothetical protein